MTTLLALLNQMKKIITLVRMLLYQPKTTARNRDSMKMIKIRKYMTTLLTLLSKPY